MKIKTVIGKEKCRCPKRRKICANRKKFIFRKSPAKRCWKCPEIIEHVSTANDSIEPTYLFGSAISVTTESFITEKHIDDFPIKDLEDMSTNLTLFNLGAGHNTVNR